MEYLLFLISTVLVNNVVLVRFLGLCPFMGVSSKLDPSIGMGVATTLVMTLGGISSWLLEHYVLLPLGIGFIRILAYIVVIAAMVQLIEMIIRKVSPELYRALGIYLPLITTNCAILALALFQTSRNYGLVEGLVFAVASGLGLMLALVLMAGIREEAELSDIPALLRGTAMSFLIAGILSLAFMGFAGLFSSS